MAAKILHSLTDDNPDLQKQIGCMTGIFQLFDRQHILTGRRLVGHTSERLLPGNSHLHNDTLGSESNNADQNSAPVEKHFNNNIQEKQRVSTESSRASFSSSHSSSFSSLDGNRTNQLDPAFHDRIRTPAMNAQNSSPQFSRQALDLRDVVKDSMYREVQGLSVKTKTVEKAPDLVKFKNFPTPQLRTPRGSQDSAVKEKETLPSDLKESFRLLAKFQEAACYHNEPRELLRSSSYHSKDGSFPISKDAPRFSFDGRERSYLPFESRDILRSTQKHKDLPRLSLDSKESTIRSSNVNSKSILHLKTSRNDGGETDCKFQSVHRTSGNQAWPTSVVAKLMGLDTLPDSVLAGDTNTTSERSYLVKFSGPSPEMGSSKPIQPSSSSKLWKEPSSPRGRNPDSFLKHISRFSNESVPKKPSDITRLSQRTAPRSTKGAVNASNTFPSVYNEIEKRLKDLEFEQSGKDLRALKRILEAMQAKGLLETQKERQDCSFTCPNDHNQRYAGSQKEARTANNRKLQTDQFLTSSKEKADSPIIIMKPAKLIQKSDLPASVIPLNGFSSLPKLQGGELIDNRKILSSGKATRDQIFKKRNRENAINPVHVRTNNRNFKIAHASARTQQLNKESFSGFRKSSESISPRMHQKKPELQKRSKQPTSPDLGKSRRLPNKQLAESSSPSGVRRSKHQNSLTSNDRLSEGTSNSSNLNFPENEISIQSNGAMILGSKNVEVTSLHKSSPEIHTTQNLLMKSADCFMSEVDKNWTVSGKELAEACAPPEYPSPVSVLDNTVYTDDSPSPVKHIGKTLKGVESINSDRILNMEDGCPADDYIQNSGRSGTTFEVNRKKLQNIDNLVQKLRRLNSRHDEAHTDYIASLCEKTSPDHRYISEILLASGLLLRDLGSSLSNFQFHPSGHPINPELFLVLEQTKASSIRKEECGVEKTKLIAQEKLHRKLFFDIVNEILARKLALIGPFSEPWLRPHKLARKTLNAQKLLKELCSEIEKLQGENSKSSFDDNDDGLKNILFEDLMHRSESWMNFNGETSCVVLDVERLIFKDLVDEVMTGTAAGSKT